MTKRLPFDDNSFDLIFHPVSNCYVYAVLPIWRECARVLKPGGRLLAGLDNGFNYAFDEDETKIINTLPFNPLEDEGQMRQLQKDDSGIQFSHTAHEQLTGQLKAGLQLLDLYEDTNGYGNLHAHNIPTYWATLARKAIRQHRTIASARFGAAFPPISRFEAFEIHTVFPRFSDLDLTKNSHRISLPNGAVLP